MTPIVSLRAVALSLELDAKRIRNELEFLAKELLRLEHERAEHLAAALELEARPPADPEENSR